VDLTNWGETEFILSFKGRLSLLELDELEFWRVQSYIQQYSSYLEKEKEQQQDQKGNMFNQNDMLKQAKQMQKDGMGNMPKFNTGMSSPNFKMPKI